MRFYGSHPRHDDENPKGDEANVLSFPPDISLNLQGSRMLQEVTRMLRFGVVGLTGFFVDAAILEFAVRVLNLNPFAGRAVSAPIAIVVTFLLNRHWSFANLNKPSIGRSFAAYVSTQGAGLLCNLAVYSILVLALPRPLGALAVASATAMLVNYLGARFWAFRS
jgi:putative flippase GtrA